MNRDILGVGTWALALCAVMVVFPVVSLAGSIAIPNNSFESPDWSDPGWGFTVDNWDKTQGGTLPEGPPNYTVFLENNEGAFGAPVGDPPQHMGMELGGYVVQELAATLAANTTYKMSALVGNRAGEQEPGPMTKFSLWVADTELGSKVVDASTEVPENDFGDFSFSFTTGDTAPAGNIVLRLEGLGEDIPGETGHVHFDNIRLDMVPEPSTLVLLGLALIALLGYGRRQ